MPQWSGFLGRAKERDRLDGVLAQARSGQSAVLVIRGEPGIGKTALLHYAARQAAGLRVARIDGVQAEMELPFAGVQRLCAPMLDRLAAIPEPQRNAINVALSAHTPVLVFCGELSAAASAVAETDAVEAATGIRSAPYGALILEAWRGRARETRELIETTDLEASARGEGIGLAVCEYARAVLCNGLGRYDEALVAAASASEHREVVAENWGLSELIEPATRTGETDLAHEALDRLAEKARAAGTGWALGVEARSRALLDDGDGAESSFRSAPGCSSARGPSSGTCTRSSPSSASAPGSASPMRSQTSRAGEGDRGWDHHRTGGKHVQRNQRRLRRPRA
jgi:hypothetical protein